MGEYSNEEWYLKEMNYYISEYGEIPPHWVIYPDAHPYSIRWRMGSGETFAMVFTNWFEDNFTGEKARIEFFLKYPPPPRWLRIMASYLWSEMPMDNFEQSEHLEKLKRLGFKRTSDYLADLENPKWLDYE